MAKLWQFSQGHPKPTFSKKSAKGDQRKFFKNCQKSSPRLKGPKALWRKRQYPLISMQLKCKDWRRFWRKQRLQKWANGEVMAILERSHKTRIFWKSAKSGPREIFQKSPKSILPLKRPTALWRKLHYTLISMHLYWKDWKRFWRKRRLQKCPNRQVMAIFARWPKTRIFWKSAKRGSREIFQKSPKK